jgi:hypothetical protein
MHSSLEVHPLPESIMKKRLNTLIGVVALIAMLPAFAGPDWLAIEQARKNKREQLAQAEKTSPEAKCAAMRLVLPLDHGPRAQTTSYLNEKRRASFEAEQKACKEAAARGVVQ